MISIDKMTADGVWSDLVATLYEIGDVQESRDGKVKELMHASFTLLDPRQRIVFARAINPAFAIAEVMWIMSGGNRLEWLTHWNPRMKNYSDDGEILSGAYGHRLGCTPQIGLFARTLFGQDQWQTDQLQVACEVLRRFPDSRQVVLQIWDKDLDAPDWTGSPSKDIPCNLFSHLLVRNGQLEWLQVMRSNDAVWGLPYNLIQFTMMQEFMAGWIGCGLGTYNHVSDSLHIYERHWQDFGGTDEYDLWHNDDDLRLPYPKWIDAFGYVTNQCARFTNTWTYTEILQILTELVSIKDEYPAYYHLGIVLGAEKLRLIGETDAASHVILQAGRYWEASWRLWAKSKGMK